MTDTDITAQMFLIVVAWLGTVLFVTRQMIKSPDGSVGLPIAFLFATTFFYCGAFTYAVPGYTHMRGDGNLYLQAYRYTEQTILKGAFTSLLGIVGFALGCFIPGRVAVPQVLPTQAANVAPPDRRQLMLMLGGLSLLGFLLNFVKIPIPLLQAVGLVLRSVAVAFVCLGAALTVDGEKSRYRVWLMIGAAIPAAYLVIWGFTSYGFLVMTVFAGFWLTMLARRRWDSLRLGFVGGGIYYALLSLFVAWMSFRDELRVVLWGENTGFGERVGAVFKAFSKTVLLVPTNFTSLDLMNMRLSQSMFVGKAVELHAAVPSLRQNGKTLLTALFAFVPRFMWPDKPTMNDNTFLSQNTGVLFSPDATFGSGAVLEFFVNFGQMGVFFGFLFLGLFIRLIDRAAARALREERPLDYVRWFVVGLAFVAPLTSFFFMVNTALISWLLVSALKYVIPAEQPALAQS